MQKQPPSIGAIAIAAGFTLSVFGLFLFLWSAFGGPIPFKPQSYRFTADFPEATQLAVESDVRISGVSVGKVKQIELPEDASRTRATIEMEEPYAPVPRDARAMLRQKTLLGETYVELTQGTKTAEKLPEGAHLGEGQVRESVNIDDIFQGLDPETRQAFRDWMRHQGEAIEGRGADLSAAFGNLGPFAADASDVLELLDSQEQSLQRLVRNTGEFFAALTERENELAQLIENSNATFSATAERDEALAETFRVFPTFLDESKATLERLETFSVDTHPLVNDLKPVADELAPTLRNVRLLAPDLRDLFRDLDPLIVASRTGLPALRTFLDELSPLLRDLDPFLGNLNPVIRFLNYHKVNVADFIAGPGAALSGKLPPVPGQPAPKSFLRQTAPTGSATLAIHRTRLSSNRGNAYLQPKAIGNKRSNEFYELFPSWDCVPSGGEQKSQAKDPGPQSVPPACTIQGPYPSAFGGKHYPQVKADD